MTAGDDLDTARTHPSAEHPDEPRSWWRSPVGIVTLGFLGVAGYFLITEHTAHVFSLLPWLLIGGCLLMHLFMHHGHHGGHDHSAGSAHPGSEPKDKP